MDISDRKKQILKAVIDYYIQTAEPVGSKTISKSSGLGLSPATIRNEMAELESLGLLEQPHTSAGRIPSPLGYRMYVNELMLQHRLTIEEAEAINRVIKQRMQQLDRLISDVGRLASQLTRYPAYALSAPAQVTILRFDIIHVDAQTFIVVTLLSNNTVKNKLFHIPGNIESDRLVKLANYFNAHFTGITEDQISFSMITAAERALGDVHGLVPIIVAFAIEVLLETKAGEAYITGASHLLQQPEFRDPDKAHRLLSYLANGEKLLQLPAPDCEGDVKVLIGPENVAEELRDSSVIMASYNMGENTHGLVGIVGPTRMDYAKIAAKIGYLASGLSKLLKSDYQGNLDGPGSSPDSIHFKGVSMTDEVE